MKTLQFYYQCWVEVAKQNRYQDKWLTDETYFRAIKAQFPSLDELGFDRGIMNRAISVCGGAMLDDFTTSNTIGIFRRKARGIDPFSNQCRMIWGYYVTTPGGLVARPPDGKKSFLSLTQDDMINDRYSVARGSPEIIDLTSEIHTRFKAKRKADAVAAVAAEDNDDNKKPRALNSDPESASAMVLVESYWDSPEAKKLFLGSSTDNRSVVEVLQQRVERLQQVNRTSDGWRDLIDKHDIDNLCSPYDIFIIRQRCAILCSAYIVALEEMNSIRWVEDCCAQAIYDCNRIGIEAAATNERTVAAWNILLRGNREHFPLPDPKIRKQKKPLPDLLDYFYKEIHVPWVDYCITNLADLTVELARNELITKIIPKCSSRQNDNGEEIDDDDNELEYRPTANEEEKNADEQQENTTQRKTIRECLLQAYIETPISVTTTWRWLRRLGFHHDSRKKSFFVDGHERPNVVCHRNEFCSNYLSKLEPRTHRWIQVTRETVEQWKSENRIREDAAARGFTYQDDEGTEMVEFHVDDYNFLQQVAEEMGFGIFGGNLSVRKPPEVKPLMIFGQDESVFNQFLLKSKQWVGPQGQRPLLPKTEGLSLMLSAFQSRETGFGAHINRIQLDEINDSRRGKNYVDIDAAMAVTGQAGKKDLKESPFVVSFELGANNEGYWTYNHMSIQFEDCVDCLQVLYPQFDFVFLFDHSQGHAKKLTNGLDAYSMNRGYGGAQPRMRESTIKEHDGYLGMNQRTLSVGDTQSFVFNSNDDGPFWLSAEERELNRHNRILPPPPGTPRTRNKTIAELKAELTPLSILNDRRQYRLAELQEIARSNNVDPRIERTREKKGWVDQPKGLLQVLWERGWIDESNFEKYKMDLEKDDDGEVVEGAENWSSNYLMASCLDFAEDPTPRATLAAS